MEKHFTLSRKIVLFDGKASTSTFASELWAFSSMASLVLEKSSLTQGSPSLLFLFARYLSHLHCPSKPLSYNIYVIPVVSHRLEPITSAFIPPTIYHRLTGTLFHQTLQATRQPSTHPSYSSVRCRMVFIKREMACSVPPLILLHQSLCGNCRLASP